MQNKPMDMEEIFTLGFRFNPSPVEAVTYCLPRLISGEQLLDAARLIHHADVYGYEPKDLAGKFNPVPRSESGDRFFFSVCKRQKGSSTRSVRAAGSGTWVSQKTKEITNDAGIKIGETKSFRFKKDGVYTDWLMEEYHCCLEQAVVGDAEKVLCRMYVSPRARPESAARQESAAVLRQEPAPPAPAPAPRPEPVITHVPKRPAPVAEPPCPKRMRGAVPIRPVEQPARVTAFAPPRPWCAPQLQAPSRPTPSPLVSRRVMAPGPAPPASGLPRSCVPACPVVQGFVARPAPACSPAAPHRPLTEAPAAAEDDAGFANFLEMDQFVSSLEDMLDWTGEGTVPTGQQNPAAEADDDLEKFASSLEQELTVAQTQEAAADDAEADDDMGQYGSLLEEELMLAQTKEAAAEEQTAEGAELPRESATVLPDFLARYGEMESEAAAANELQKALDVLNDFGDDQIDGSFLTVPLKDYNDQLFY